MSIDRHLAATFEPDRWVPPPGIRDTYRVAEFIRASGMSTFDELLERAQRNPEWYFPAAMSFLGLEWLEPWQTVRDESDGPEFAHWFSGAKTNLAWLVTRGAHRLDAASAAPGRAAVVHSREDGTVTELTADELEREVATVAAGLLQLGVQAGDVVAMLLPMIPEAVVSLLAVARIGAIVMPAFSGFGADALRERIQLGAAKLLITCDATSRRGREVSLVDVAVRAIDGLDDPPGLVVVSNRFGQGLPAGATAWSRLRASTPLPEYLPFDSDHPWLLTFTSGSTGRPKGVVHTHGGMPYGSAVEMAFAFDLRPGDRLCWPSDMGWINGPMCALASLALGASVVLVEGAIDYPAPDRLWQLTDELAVTQLGVGPSAARLLSQHGDHWIDEHGLASLRTIGSTGEPWTIPAWKWLHRHAGRGRAPIINWAGGTEVGGGILTGSPMVATVAGRFSRPTLGMAAEVVDEAGRPLLDEMGELVVTRSWPHMTHGFWHDDARYIDTYWTAFPGWWVQGDRAIRYSDGSWEIVGRSDDVIKVAGKRVGPSEFESLSMEVDGVRAAGAVGVTHSVKGDIPVVAVVIEEGADVAEVLDAVAARATVGLGRALAPVVVPVPELPMTRNGKVHRRALRAWLGGMDAGDLSSLENPSAEHGVRASAPHL